MLLAILAQYWHVIPQNDIIMNQPIWILAACALLIMSCGRKTVPAKTSHVTTANKLMVKDIDDTAKEPIRIPDTKEKEEKAETKKQMQKHYYRW